MGLLRIYLFLGSSNLSILRNFRFTTKLIDDVKCNRSLAKHMTSKT